MKLTDQTIYRFDNEIKIFAQKYGLTAETNHATLDARTEVTLSKGVRYKKYVVEWHEVPSIVAALNTVISDASLLFGARRTNDPTVYECPFAIKDVIFSNPATIVLWEDGTKTVVKRQEGDEYSEEVGLALCFAKKALGNKSNFNNVFKKWIPEEEEEPVVIGVDPFSLKSNDTAKPFRSAAELLEELSESIRNRREHPRGV